MNTEEKQLFYLIIKAIENAFLETHKTSTPIEEWKGDEIVLFQEDLFDKTKGKVSEKWFYTYIKNTSEKLPRIDVLNLLSNYVGYSNWQAFKAANRAKHLNTKKKKIRSKLWLLFIIPVLIIVFNFKSENTFEFCFLDAVKNEKIVIPIDITILQDNESPVYYKTDSIGCFKYKTKEDVIKFIVKSPYHKTDTIIRNINSNSNQIVKIIPDDYALMMHYYTSGNVIDWKKHIKKLNELIDDNAKIYRLFNNTMNIELYSKEEFIRMITIPTKSLKRTEILDKTVKNGKIVTLKFMVK